MSSVPTKLAKSPFLKAAAHAGSLAAVVLACKIHRLIIGYSHASVVVRLYSLAADLSFLLAYATLCGWLLGRPRVGPYLMTPLRVVTIVLAGCALVDHGFFLATGATLDWYIASYAVSHVTELLPILAHEGRKLGLTLMFVVGIALLPKAVGALPIVQRFVTRAQGATFARRGRWTSAAFYLLPLVPVVVLLTSSVAESFDASSHNLYLRLGKGAVGELAKARTYRLATGPSTGQTLVEARADRHYNVVLVVLESARARSFSPYAREGHATPFFESLTRAGTLVETAYAVVPHTTKALVSIQCGIYPRLDPEPYEAAEKGIPTRCLADLLRASGYATAFFQPAESNFERRRELVDQFGYEVFVGRQTLPSKGFDESNYLGLEDKALIRPVMNWVDEQSKPFLLTALTLASHHPYAVPVGFVAQHHSDNAVQNDYENTIAYTDDFLRQLYGEFERRGLLEQTIFVILGDHGEGFGEHGVFIHDAVPYEEGLRVPMVLVGPGFAPGRRIGGLRQNIDVLPTVLEAIGFALQSRSLPGRSLLSTPGHERLYFACHYRDYCLASRDARRKFVYHYARRSPELFDLVDDPEERENLAKSNAIGTRSLIDDLERWKWRVNAQFVEGREWHLTHEVGMVAPPIAYPLDVRLGSDVRLLGYDIERHDLGIGEQMTITHYFRAERKPDPSHRLAFHLEGPTTEDLSHTPVHGTHPVSHWRPGEYVTDRFVYFARPGTVPGAYRLMVGLSAGKDPAEGTVPVRPYSPEAHVDERRRVETASWSVVPNHFDKNDYVYAAPPQGFGEMRVLLSPEIELHGCSLSKKEIKRGIRTTLSCLYHVLVDHPPRTICTRLEGPVSKTIEHAPVHGKYPTSEWRAGQYVRDEMDILLYNADPDGEYRVTVGTGIDTALQDEPARGCGGSDDGGVEVAKFILRG